MEKVKELLSMIYPNKDDKNYLMMTIATALCGIATMDQSILFLLGKGSSGKSTVMKMLKNSIGMYFVELKSDTFVMGNQKADKILNTLLEKPHARLIWVNELADKKMDDSLFKSVCEGTAQTTRLFQDGVTEIQMNALIMITANTFPSIKIDSGVVCRIKSHTHMSEFVDEENKVDKENNIYLKDKYLEEKMRDDGMANAFLKYVANYAKKYYKGIRYEATQNFKDTKECITSSNDTIQDYIDVNLIITEDEKDRIGRDEMIQNFKLTNPKSLITCMQLINSLKDKGIRYEGTFRYKKLKGCYLGVKFSENNESDSESENEDKPDYKTKYDDLLKKYQELERKYNQLKIKPQIIEDIQKESKKKTKKVEKEDEEPLIVDFL